MTYGYAFCDCCKQKIIWPYRAVRNTVGIQTHIICIRLKQSNPDLEAVLRMSGEKLEEHRKRLPIEPGAILICDVYDMMCLSIWDRIR